MSCSDESKTFTSGNSPSARAVRCAVIFAFASKRWHRLEEQRLQRISFERAELQKLKQRGKPLCVSAARDKSGAI